MSGGPHRARCSAQRVLARVAHLPLHTRGHAARIASGVHLPRLLARSASGQNRSAESGNAPAPLPLRRVLCRVVVSHALSLVAPTHECASEHVCPPCCSPYHACPAARMRHAAHLRLLALLRPPGACSTAP
jgi:hypothetical protein